MPLAILILAAGGGAEASARHAELDALEARARAGKAGTWGAGSVVECASK